MDWSELFQPSVMVFVVVGTIAVVAIISGAVTRHARTKAEIELKQTMVEQGRSAEEIERVLAARGRSTRTTSRQEDRETGHGPAPAHSGSRAASPPVAPSGGAVGGAS
jgi:hypothetical protein